MLKCKYSWSSIVVIAVLIFATMPARSAGDEWVLKTGYSDEAIDSECFARVRHPNHVAVGYRLDGSPFVSLATSRGPDFTTKLGQLQSSGPKVWIKGDKSAVGPLEFNWDASNGDLYYHGAEARIVHLMMAFSPRVNFRIKMPNSIKRYSYAISVKAARQAITGLQKCEPKPLPQMPDESGLALFMFKKLSNYPPANIQQVVNAFEEKVSFGGLVQKGIITKYYDCAPEDRVSCYEALKNPSSQSALEIIQEWGEWEDAFSSDPIGFRKFVSHHVKEAKRKGFSLFSDAEKGMYHKLKVFEAAAGQCKMGENIDGTTMSENEIFHICAIRDGYWSWLKKSMCFDRSEYQWFDCMASVSENYQKQ